MTSFSILKIHSDEYDSQEVRVKINVAENTLYLLSTLKEDANIFLIVLLTHQNEYIFL